MALVASGQARQRDWRAAGRTTPSPPDPSPRHADIAPAVLRLTSQQDQITFRNLDGGVPAPQIGDGWVIGPAVPQPPPPPHIENSRGPGPASASETAPDAHQHVGLLSDGGWAPAVRGAIWRTQPPEWLLDVNRRRNNPAGVERANEAMPAHMTTLIKGLAAITDDDIARHMAWCAKAHEDHARRWGDGGLASRGMTTDEARQSLLRLRSNDLDWLFFRSWRLRDGWLTSADEQRATDIFHDRRAILTGKAVIARRRPDVVDFTAP